MMTITPPSAEIRTMQREWAVIPVRARVRVVRKVRHELAEAAGELAAYIPRPPRESLTSEILPLLEACRFLERNAEKILAPRLERTDGQPIWLRAIDIEIRREPLGVVLVIGPSNYPVFLAAVHTLQALVAGNCVILKPGRGAYPALHLFVSCLVRGGIPPGVVQLSGEAPEDAEAAIDCGVDKVVFTGSNTTGRAVMQHLARFGTPSVMELSGHDSVFVRPDADIGLVVRALRFGTGLNGGDTCIAPKQVIAWNGVASLLRDRLEAEEIRLPVLEVSSDDEALSTSTESGYALGAAVFGGTNDAVEFARRIHAGCVVVNDMIAPTAHPRIPFGGRGKSGFGVTRGAEGLLELTAVKAIAVRRTKWLPHLDPPHPSDESLFRQYIGWSHGKTLACRLRALVRIVLVLMSRR